MERYNLGDYFANGSNGSVAYAVKLENKHKYAVKKLKRHFQSWDEAVNAREVQALLKLRHENIVKLKEVVRENDEAFLIFEAMDGTLSHLIKSMDKDFNETSIITIMWQILQGLRFLHEKGFFHRNLTTENILCKVPNLVKISGFTTVKDSGVTPPHTPNVTEVISMSPEMLLGSRDYTSSIDIWSAGTIMAHLYLRKPLFEAKTHIDYLVKICATLGAPDERYWPAGYKLAKKQNIKFPKLPRKPLTRTIKNASDQAILLMHDMIRWVPARRPSVATCLSYSYFAEKAAKVKEEEEKAAKLKAEEDKEREASNVSSSPPDSFGTRIRPEDFTENTSYPKLTYYSGRPGMIADSMGITRPIDNSLYPPPRRLYRVASEPTQLRMNDLELSRISMLEHASYQPRPDFHEYYFDDLRPSNDWHSVPSRISEDIRILPRRPRMEDIPRSYSTDFKPGTKTLPALNINGGSITGNSNAVYGNLSGSSINSNNSSSTRPGTPNVHGRVNWAAKYLK